MNQEGASLLDQWSEKNRPLRTVRQNSLKITDWEAGSRYDVAFSIRIDTLTTAYRVITEWFDRIQ